MQKNKNNSVKWRFRFNASWAPYLTPFLLSVFMSSLVSLVVTFKINGITENIVSNWLLRLTLRITCAEGLELRRAVDSGRYAIPRMTALFTDTPSNGLRPLLALSSTGRCNTMGLL